MTLPSISLRRVVIGALVALLVLALAVAGLGAAWMAGIRVPFASGATYMQIQKLATADTAGARTDMFFIALIGSDLRPGISGARGDALHLVGVNPATNTATMLNIPRDTCWKGDKINSAHSSGGPRGMAEAMGEIVGVPVAYVVSVDFARLRGPGRRHGRRADRRAGGDERPVLRCGLPRRTTPLERQPGARVLAQPSRLLRQRPHAHRKPRSDDHRRARTAARRSAGTGRRAQSGGAVGPPRRARRPRAHRRLPARLASHTASIPPPYAV